MRTIRIAALAAVFTCASALAAGTPAAPAAAPSVAAKPAAATPAKPTAAKPAAPPQMWFMAKTGSGAIAYDGYSIKADPVLGTVTMSSILYLTTLNKTPDGKAFQFVVADDTIDCYGDKFQPSLRRFLAADGTLIVKTGSQDKKWYPLSDNPPLAFLKRIACQGAPLAKSKQTAHLADAIVQMRALAAGK